MHLQQPAAAPAAPHCLAELRYGVQIAHGEQIEDRRSIFQVGPPRAEVIRAI